ncbi:MAG: hypothetical protein LUD68_09495 [Rikenellaceae bacterium]|nr:hypothetical protein [Rikenellaceae bacterium]
MNLIEYIRGNRKGRAAHQLEKEAMSDPFLADALEGFESVKADHPVAIEVLKNRIRIRSQLRRFRNIRWLAASAAVLLLLWLLPVRDFLLREPPQTARILLSEALPVQPNGPVAYPDKSPGSEIPALTGGPADIPDSSQDRHPENPALPARSTAALGETGAASVRKEPEGLLPENSVQPTPSTPEGYRVAAALQPAGFSEQKNPDASLEQGSFSPKQRSVQPIYGDFSTAQENSELPGSSEKPETDPPIREESAEYPELLTSEPGRTVDYARAAQPGESNPDSLPEHRIRSNELPYLCAKTAPEDSPTECSAAGSDLEVSLEKIRGRPLPFGQPKGGMEVFREYLDRNQSDILNSSGEPVRGTVLLDFRIDRHGRPAGIRIRKGLNAEANAEARKLLMEGPDWIRVKGRVQAVIEF